MLMASMDLKKTRSTQDIDRELFQPSPMSLVTRFKMRFERALVSMLETPYTWPNSSASPYPSPSYNCEKSRRKS